jgi:glyceraldehyde-3-phosphate dehydrogenase/erythrose-4-phosphate dehydrogenase
MTATAVVGIVGLGRTGRSLVRALREHPRLRVGAIRDPAEAVQLEYLLKYDTILGRFPEAVSLKDGHLRIGSDRIPLLAGRTATPCAGATSASTSCSRRRSTSRRPSGFASIGTAARGA